MRSRGRAKILQGLGRCAAPVIVGPGDGKMNCLEAFVTLLNSKCMPGAALLPLHLKSRNVSGGKRNIHSPGRRLHQQPRLNTPGSQTSTDRSSHPDPDAQSSDGQWPAYDWLLSDVIPHHMSEPNHNELKTADTLARDLKREHGDACPFSEEALRDAIPRAFVPITAYTFDPEEPLQTDVTLLPSDPYANPRLLRALEYGLRCLDAEAL
jgi:hypothetical protein